MSTTPNTPAVVVVTEEKKRRKGLIWIAGGTAALLAGGSTFALWSASDSFDGGTITAGDLNIVEKAPTTFWDVSADRADATATLPGTDGTIPGHSITSIDDWRIVPGDEVAAAFSANVTLEGDNLVALLSLDGMTANELNNTEMVYKYEIYHDGAKLISKTDLPEDEGAPLLYLSAQTDGQAAGLDDARATGTPVYAMTNGKTADPVATDDFTVVVYGEFTDTGATQARNNVTVADTLGDSTLKLEQVRDTGAQF